MSREEPPRIVLQSPVPLDIQQNPVVSAFERRLDAPRPLEPDTREGREHLQRLDREVYEDLYGSRQALVEARGLVAELTRDFEKNPKRVAIQRAFGRLLSGLPPASPLEEQVARLYATRAERWERLAQIMGIPRPDSFRLYRGSRGLDYAFDVAQAWADDEVSVVRVVQDALASWSLHSGAARRFMQDAPAAVTFGIDAPFEQTFADKLVDGGTFIVPYQNQSEVLLGRPHDGEIFADKKLTIVRFGGRIYTYEQRDELIDVLPWED